MANVLVIGINYAPESTGIAPYTRDFAEYLAAKGHSVTVITGFPHYPAWQVPATERRWRATELRAGVRVLRRRHYVPRSQSALRRAFYELTFLVHGALSNPERADVVFGIVPSLGGGILARFFAWRFRAPYGLVFQDLMAPAVIQSGIQGGGRVAGTTRTLERWAVAHAQTVALASGSFRDYLAAIGVSADRVVEFPNWSQLSPPSAPREATRSRLGWPEDTTVVLHAGNMGLKQGLDQVVGAARLADALALPVLYVLMGEGSQRKPLEMQGRAVKRLQFLEFQPDEEVSNVLEAADILLVSERPTVIDMSLPSKLTFYFAAGRPIIAAVPQDGATAHEVARAGAGVTVTIHDPRAINDAVVHLRTDRALAAKLGDAGRRYAETLLDFGSAGRRIDDLIERTLRTGIGQNRSILAPDPNVYRVLGVGINGAPFDAVLRRVLDAPETGERLAVHFATAHTLVESHGSAELRDALEHGLVQPDGMPLVWLGRLSGRRVERVCGPDFMPAVMERGVPLGRRHFFYGGAPGVPEELAARLSRRYPGLQIVGTLSPPFRPLSRSEELKVAATINSAAPDYVWVGLGTPKQDLWLAANRTLLEAPVLLAVGAAFDLLAGRRRRAPSWMQRTGSEWIYRLATEPRRLGRRYTRLNARFLRLLLVDAVRGALRMERDRR